MRKGIIAGAVIAAIALAGGAYYGVAVYPTKAFRAALDQAASALPAGTRVSYRDARYSFTSGGASITGIAVHRDTPDPFDLSIDTIEVTKPALDFAAAWKEAASHPTAVAPDLGLRLADAATASGVSYHAADGTLAVRSIAIDRPCVHPWALLHPGVPSLGEARADLLARPQVTGITDLTPQLRAASSELLGIAYDGYVVTDLAASVHLPAMRSVPARDIAYAVAKMTVGAFDRGNLASFLAETITVTAAELGSAKIDRIAVADLRMQATLMRWIEGEVSPASFDGLTLKRLEYGPLTVQPAGGAATTLGTFSLANVAFADGAPVAADMAIDGLRVNLAQIAAVTGSDLGNTLGIDTLELKLALSYKWDVEQRRLTVANAAIAAKGLGALTLSFELDDAAPGAHLETSARLAHALLHYEDASLLKRALAVAAARINSDADGLRQHLIAEAGEMAAAAAGNDAVIAASHAVADFLAAPRSLTVELAPPQPVKLLTLIAGMLIPPPRLAAMLGLAVSANR